MFAVTVSLILAAVGAPTVLPASGVPAAPAAPAPAAVGGVRISDADVAGWVAESLIAGTRAAPVSRAELLARSGLFDDLQVAQDVGASLTAAGVQSTLVGCSDGAVVLRGRVDSAARRDAAARLAQTVAGVRSVQNLLRLPGEDTPAAAPPANTAVDAAGTAADAAVASGPARSEAFDFLTGDSLAGRAIVVDAAAGVVTLSGVVNSEPARRYAMDAAQRAPGVRAVRDRLTVATHNTIEDRGIALLLQRRIENSASLEDVAAAILVSASNGVVTLQGRVRDAYQLEAAEALARGTEVVFAVSNQLKIDEDLIAPWQPGVRDFRIWRTY